MRVFLECHRLSLAAREPTCRGSWRLFFERPVKNLAGSRDDIEDSAKCLFLARFFYCAIKYLVITVTLIGASSLVATSEPQYAARSLVRANLVKTRSGSH